jgi:hypothetical protein
MNAVESFLDTVRNQLFDVFAHWRKGNREQESGVREQGAGNRGQGAGIREQESGRMLQMFLFPDS